jgi:hypothetical protein
MKCATTLLAFALMIVDAPAPQRPMCWVVVPGDGPTTTSEHKDTPQLIDLVCTATEAGSDSSVNTKG